MAAAEAVADGVPAVRAGAAGGPAVTRAPAWAGITGAGTTVGTMAVARAAAVPPAAAVPAVVAAAVAAAVVAAEVPEPTTVTEPAALAPTPLAGKGCC
ncbi:hypothetical protein HOK021_02540 [Streptomyces hygroscopicus]|nr:hypothetical protein HOK021_02540 [Streptomyces hygroscopicus]